jgi:gas vesicle protein
MSKNTRNVAIGVVLAAAAGYVAGILTAPKSGKETRQDLKNTAIATKEQMEAKIKSLQADASKLLKDANSRLKSLSGAAKAELQEAIVRAQIAKDKAREVVRALNNGEADDEDLNNAVQDLRTSISHLKIYASKNSK